MNQELSTRLIMVLPTEIENRELAAVTNNKDDWAQDSLASASR
jgi:hypothetical protein